MNKINTWIIDYEMNNIQVCITKDKNDLGWHSALTMDKEIKQVKRSALGHMKSSENIVLYENTTYYIGITMPINDFESNYFSDAKNIFYNQFVNEKITFFPEGMYKKDKNKFIHVFGEFKTEFNVGDWDFSVKLIHSSNYRDAEVYISIHPQKINFEYEYTSMLNDISLEVSELLVKYTTSNVSQMELEISNQNTKFESTYINLRQCINELILILEEIKLKPYIKTEQKRIVSYTGTQSNIDMIELSSNYMKYDPQQGGPLSERLRNTTPRVVPETKNNITYDNFPNQYLKFVINNFTNILIDASEYFSKKDQYSLYCNEISEWLEYFEENLQYSFLNSVTLKSRFMNYNSQVLYTRDGYKELFRVVEKYNNALHFNLSFSDTETDKYYVKPVYDLYEMWCFLVVKKVLNRLIGKEASQDLIVSESSKISINLKTGDQSKVIFEHNSRVITLYYNKTYTTSEDRSYSMDFRPDISIECFDTVNELTKIYLLDAKYKLENLTRKIQGKTVEVKTHTKNDIYKMHAYKDSIYNTIAAYILYPGDESTLFQKKSDTFEGVGAFNLIPGKVNDIDSLEKHLQTLLSL